MQTTSNTLKSVALASLFGLAAIAAGTTAASARTYTHCIGDRCVRMNCDWDGGNCWRESVYYRNYDHHRDYDRGYYGGYYGRYADRHWSCDADGNNCHWVYD